MADPGLYQHFKGPRYRVLFSLTWVDYERPENGDAISIYADASSSNGLSAVCGHRKPPRTILTATWAGGGGAPECDASVSAGDEIVVYANLDGVFARTTIEFEQQIRATDGALIATRFQRVGA